MQRYRLVTNDGVTEFTTVSHDDAKRALLPTGTLVAEDVEPLGRIGGAITGHILWADGRRSLASDATRDIPPLVGPAGKILGLVYGSDSPDLDAVGGLPVVASVRECTTSVVARDPRPTRGGYQSPLIEQLEVVLADGSRRTWYAASVGYGEGYLYVVVLTYDEAAASFDEWQIDAQLEPVS